MTKGHPGEPELRKTPTQFIAMLRSGSHTADKLYYSLLNAQYLYGIDGQVIVCHLSTGIKKFIYRIITFYEYRYGDATNRPSAFTIVQ